MLFEDIQAFVTVMRAGSFSKAAVDLCVAQSALSKRVKRLETRMGTTLLERHARGVVATESGRVFFARAEKLVDELSEMERDLSSFVQEPIGTVRVALPPRTSGLLGPRLLARKLAELPKVRLELLEGSPAEIHGWLSRGQADIALAYNDEVGPSYDVTPVLTEPLHLFCRYSLLHTLFEGRIPERLSIHDLCRVPLIMPRRPHVLRVMVDRLCTLNNVRPQVIFETEGAHTTRGMIEHGIGGTVFSMSTSTWSHIAQEGQVVAVPFKSPLVCWNLFLVKAREAKNLVALNRIEAIITQEIDELIKAGAWAYATKPLAGQSA